MVTKKTELHEAATLRFNPNGDQTYSSDVGHLNVTKQWMNV